MSGVKQSEKVAAKFPVKGLAVGVIYAILTIILVTYYWGFTNFGATYEAGAEAYPPLWDWPMCWNVIAIVMVVSFIPFLGISILPKGLFSQQDLTVIYTTVLMGPVWISSLFFGPTILMIAGSYGAVAPDPYSEWYFKNMSPFWTPKDPSVFEGFLYGGASVPWGIWVTPMMWWIAFCILWALFYAFWAALMRYVFIDVERFPFPLAVSAAELVKSAEGTERPPLFKAKWFLVGFLISIVSHITDIVHFFYLPLLIYRPAYDFTRLITASSVPWSMLYLNFFAFNIALGYIISFDVAITASIVSFLMHFLTGPILAGMGVIPPTPSPVDYWWIWGDLYSWGPSGGLAWQPWNFGLIAGLALWVFWLGRGAVKKIIKSIYTKPSPEIEANAPLPYRVMWAGFIISAIALIGVIAALGISALWAIMYLIIYSVFFLGSTVWRGESGGYGGGHTSEIWHGIMPNTALAAAGLTMTERAPIGMSQAISINQTYYGFGYFNPLPNCMESYKLGELTKTKSSHLFASQVITYIVAFAVAFPLTLVFGYQLGAIVKWNFGWRRILIAYYHTSFDSLDATFGYWKINWGMEAVKFIIGLVMAFGLSGVRLAHPAFIISPVGLLLAGTTMMQVFPSFLIGAVLRRMTERVGGTKLFYEKGIPIALGIQVGFGFVVMLGNIGRILTGI